MDDEQKKLKKEYSNEKEVKILEEQDEEVNEDINLFFQKTLKNTVSAFFLSLISTIVNFTCNIPLLRKVSKESYGVVKVYFELAFALVNFVPRETMRRTSQKFCADKDPKKENEKFITLSQINYLFLLLTSIISIFIFFSFVLFTDSQKLHENLLHLLIYIICAVVELLIVLNFGANVCY
jgi:O-antigen/teichoic acid export membrane protein